MSSVDKKDLKFQKSNISEQEAIFMGELDILLKELLSESYCKKKTTSIYKYAKIVDLSFINKLR